MADEPAADESAGAGHEDRVRSRSMVVVIVASSSVVRRRSLRAVGRAVRSRLRLRRRPLREGRQQSITTSRRDRSRQSARAGGPRTPATASRSRPRRSVRGARRPIAHPCDGATEDDRSAASVATGSYTLTSWPRPAASSRASATPGLSSITSVSGLYASPRMPTASRLSGASGTIRASRSICGDVDRVGRLGEAGLGAELAREHGERLVVAREARPAVGDRAAEVLRRRSACRARARRSPSRRPRREAARTCRPACSRTRSSW